MGNWRIDCYNVIAWAIIATAAAHMNVRAKKNSKFSTPVFPVHVSSSLASGIYKGASLKAQFELDLEERTQRQKLSRQLSESESDSTS